VQGTVLFAGPRRHQQRAIQRAAELGLQVVFEGPADTILPDFGPETTHLLGNRIALRRRFADLGVAQPAFAAVRGLQDARSGVETVGVPAVLKPADSGGHRGIFRLSSVDDVDAHLHATLAESPDGEAIVESFHDGQELNAVAVVQRGEAKLVLLCDEHVYPTTLFGDALELAESTVVSAVHALGLERGVAYLRLVASDDGEIRVLDVAAGLPDDEIAELARHAIGIDLVEIALRQALGEDVPDELTRPRFSQPVALKLLAAEPGAQHTVGPLDKVLAFPGVVAADIFETAVPLDEDLLGYVIAIADTNLEARERSEAAATLVDVVVE
jgi:biotin carboxylase